MGWNDVIALVVIVLITAFVVWLTNGEGKA